MSEEFPELLDLSAGDTVDDSTLPHMSDEESYGDLATQDETQLNDHSVLIDESTDEDPETQEAEESQGTATSPNAGAPEAQPAAAASPNESEQIYSFLMDMQGMRHNTAMTTINNMR
jgi:hypothetical protein